MCWGRLPWREPRTRRVHTTITIRCLPGDRLTRAQGCAAHHQTQHIVLLCRRPSIFDTRRAACSSHTVAVRADTREWSGRGVCGNVCVVVRSLHSGAAPVRACVPLPVV